MAGIYKQISGFYANNTSATPSLSMSQIDSPSTTSAVTYTIYFATDSGGDQRMNQNGTTSTIQLFEIAG